MLGIAGISLLTILAIIGVAYFLDYMRWLDWLAPVPIIGQFVGAVPKTPLFSIIAIGCILIGSGVVSADLTGVLDNDASTVDVYGADIPINVKDGAGTAFADTGYSFLILDYDTYASNDAYDLFSEIKTYGTAGLIGPDGEAAATATLSAGVITIDSYLGSIGDRIIIFGYDDTTPGAGDYEFFMQDIELVSYNAETSEFTSSPNKFTLNTFGTMDSYNYAGTDIAGYVEDEDAAKVGMSMNYDLYSNGNFNITKDMVLFAEIPTALQSKVNKITVSTVDRGDNNNLQSIITSFQDTTNMDTSNFIFESKPDLTVSTSKMYFVGDMFDTYRTSATNLDRLNVEVNYDHTGTDAGVIYFYAVQLAEGGSDTHFDIAASPAFALNVTSSGTDGFTT